MDEGKAAREKAQAIREETEKRCGDRFSPECRRAVEAVVANIIEEHQYRLALEEIAQTDLSGLQNKDSVGDDLEDALVSIASGYQAMARASLDGEWHVIPRRRRLLEAARRLIHDVDGQEVCFACMNKLTQDSPQQGHVKTSDGSAYCAYALLEEAVAEFEENVIV